MVGLQTLDLAIGVRVPASQPNRNYSVLKSTSFCVNSIRLAGSRSGRTSSRTRSGTTTSGRNSHCNGGTSNPVARCLQPLWRGTILWTQFEQHFQNSTTVREESQQTKRRGGSRGRDSKTRGFACDIRKAPLAVELTKSCLA